ncbi:hypothetical protein CDL12_10386 [Handroanthus impetiginosus]|uniref:Bet v I/Major latex protein domain-containing protein n=1 Tax=Handroanthus impetiginosus TaxID=429701 RepID=A0A2G9HHI2_9LAMI|nr:hypothetical protein CDL12_10386 [Handroanthus impetiginosus]
MGATTYDMEIPSSIHAAKMFKAIVLDADILVPRIIPQAVKNVRILEGDGGVGTVKLIHFGEGSQYKNGGCICKNRSIYHTKEGVAISGEDYGKDKTVAMFKAIEAYLQAN